MDKLDKNTIMDNEYSDGKDNFSPEELENIYAACMYYGQHLTEVSKSIPNEEYIVSCLADKVKSCLEVAKKVSNILEEEAL